MSKLGQVVESVEKYNQFVLDQVRRARTDNKFGRDLLGRWNDIKAKIPITRAPTGLPLPRLALPEIDESGEVARYLFGEGLPGEFPFLNGAYREMYLETIRETAAIIMAMYIAAAKRRFGPKVVPKLRGTIQADIFKEVQAQNETIFPIEPSLRFLTDTVEFTTREMPRWYPISISGYHIGEAGSTPVQQAAYTLSNGFAYVEIFAGRGIPVHQFGRRLSVFLDVGLDVEFVALARVSGRVGA